MKQKIVLLTFLVLFVSLSPFGYSQSGNQISEDEWKPLSELAQAQKGDLIYVDFWASWCIPCRKSFPWLNSMQEKYGDKGFKVVAINVDSSRDLADKFLEAVPATFPIFYDPDGKYPELLNVQGMPASYLVDSSGNVLSAHIGFKNKHTSAYEQTILKFLNR